MKMLSLVGRAAMLLACAVAIGCTGPTDSKSDESAAPAEGAPGDNASSESTSPAGSGGVAPAGSVVIAPGNASIEFVGSKEDGSSHNGGFKEFSGYFMPPADGEPGRISLTIKTPSLWADNDRLTGHLKNLDFFNVPAHPEATFESTEIKAAEGGDATHEITGDLTLLGNTESITFPATVAGEGDALTLAADFTFDRSRYGMTYENGVKQEVDVSVRVGGDAKTE